jgi:hypothetical integral membrane protein (TIGR02206 family)
MREFFSIHQGNHEQFQIFSPLHIGMLITLCAIVLSLIIFKKSLRKKGDFYRFTIAIISLVLEGSYLIWIVNRGKWNLKTSLPLELCEITFILCIIMLIWKSYLLFEVAYFWGFIGSTLALILPVLHATYRHFPFWAFMLTHSLNLIALVLMMVIEKYKPTVKSIRVSFIITNIYMLLIAIINRFLGSNYYYYYIFKKPAPNIPNPLLFANSWFIKLLLLEGVILLALFICYLPFIVTNAFKRTDKSPYQQT